MNQWTFIRVTSRSIGEKIQGQSWHPNISITTKSHGDPHESCCPGALWTAWRWYEWSKSLFAAQLVGLLLLLCLFPPLIKLGVAVGFQNLPSLCLCMHVSVCLPLEFTPLSWRECFHGQERASCISSVLCQPFSHLIPPSALVKDSNALVTFSHHRI